jgi:hypothetical protein
MRRPGHWIACALTVAVALSAGAAPPDVAAEGASPPARPGGAEALLASAAYPGLGQLMNGAEKKAAVIGAAEAFLVARLVLEDRWTRNSLRRYHETGDPDHFDEYSEHFDRRQTLIWWVIVAALYGIADAYVDAHLADFDEPLSPSLERTLGGPSGGTGDAIRVGIAIRF